MQKLRLLIIVCISTMFFSFKPHGSGTAYITGKSSSGNLIFKAEVQDIEGAVEKIELSIDGKKLNFDASCNSNVIFSRERCSLYNICRK
jgi:hypothetical protein